MNGCRGKREEMIAGGASNEQWIELCHNGMSSDEMSEAALLVRMSKQKVRIAFLEAWPRVGRSERLGASACHWSVFLGSWGCREKKKKKWEMHLGLAP